MRWLLILLICILLVLRKLLYKRQFINNIATRHLSSRPSFLSSSKLPREWSWSRITVKDSKLWSAQFGKALGHGSFTSTIFNQHMSRWCGCCYLIATLQCIQDKMNILLSTLQPDEIAHPFIKLNVQIALDAYNDLRQANHPDWNACLGGDPKILIEAIQNEKVPLILAGAEGFAWYGHPRSVTDLPKTQVFLKHEEIVLENVVESIQQAIFEFGPLVLGINANCMSDSKISERRGVIDTTVSGPRNHAVSVIGWKQINGNPHWICRNSWGKTNAPMQKPQDMTCVSTNRNACSVDKIVWKGDTSMPGYFYVPFDYGPIGGNPSPWYFFCVSDQNASE